MREFAARRAAAEPIATTLIAPHALSDVLEFFVVVTEAFFMSRRDLAQKPAALGRQGLAQLLAQRCRYPAMVSAWVSRYGDDRSRCPSECPGQSFLPCLSWPPVVAASRTKRAARTPTKRAPQTGARRSPSPRPVASSRKAERAGRLAPATAGFARPAGMTPAKPARPARAAAAIAVLAGCRVWIRAPRTRPASHRLRWPRTS